MYSESIKNHIIARKPILTVIWLMLPAEAAIFTVVVTVLLSTMPAEKPELNMTVLYAVFSAASISAMIVVLFIRSRMFKHQNAFAGDDSDKSSFLTQPPGTESLTTGEKVVLMAISKDIAFAMICSSLLSFPVVLGVIMTLLAHDSRMFTAAVILALIIWKALIPSPSAFISMFHQSIDPRYEEFVRQQAK